MKPNKIGILQFPGSNCDADCFEALEHFYGLKATSIWHHGDLPSGLNGLVIPGGFSYGDYLRAGAIASLRPLLVEVKAFIDRGGPVIGICNGFQILTEAGFLPGALLDNIDNQFVCKTVQLRVHAKAKAFQAQPDEALAIPVAHGQGRYYVDDTARAKLYDSGQVALVYEDNPNGSVDSIAGVSSENGRVLGMMPHPERALDKAIDKSTSGKFIWDAFLNLC